MSKNVNVSWQNTGRTIEGFGVFSGRAEPLFQDNNRDKILELLFSPNYLNLNIIRTKILPSFSKTEGDINFHLDADIDVKPGDADFPTDSEELERRGHLFVLKKALKHYNIDKVIASAWSPPVYMKSQKKEQGKWFNYLLSKYEDQYVNFISEFAKQFTEAGIPMYAISAMNEPEHFSAEWDGCFWEPFSIPALLNKLKKSLLSKNLKTKIMSSENGNWSVTNTYLSTILTICNFIYRSPYPVDILAGHGYAGLQDAGDINTNPFPWLGIGGDMPRWVTEACSTKDPLDINGGLKLAESIHNFVYNRDVTAYVFWLGVVNYSSEALINSNGTHYSLNGTYYALGNYSRFVRPGYRTLKVSDDKPDTDVLFSAYKSEDDSKLSCVAINKGETSKQINLTIDTNIYAITPHITSTIDGVMDCRVGNIITSKEGVFELDLPANSITTFVSE